MEDLLVLRTSPKDYVTYRRLKQHGIVINTLNDGDEAHDISDFTTIILNDAQAIELANWILKNVK